MHTNPLPVFFQTFRASGSFSFFFQLLLSTVFLSLVHRFLFESVINYGHRWPDGQRRKFSTGVAGSVPGKVKKQRWPLPHRHHGGAREQGPGAQLLQRSCSVARCECVTLPRIDLKIKTARGKRKPTQKHDRADREHAVVFLVGGGYSGLRRFSLWSSPRNIDKGASLPVTTT